MVMPGNDKNTNKNLLTKAKEGKNYRRKQSKWMTIWRSLLRRCWREPYETQLRNAVHQWQGCPKTRQEVRKAPASSRVLPCSPGDSGMMSTAVFFNYVYCYTYVGGRITGYCSKHTQPETNHLGTVPGAPWYQLVRTKIWVNLGVIK